jgi:sensor histidine kinase YesM
MRSKHHHYVNIAKHVLFWTCYFGIMAFFMSNDGSKFFGPGGIYFDKFSILLLFFPGQALLCYGVIFFIFPDVLKHGIHIRHTVIILMLFLGSFLLNYWILGIFQAQINQRGSHIPDLVYYGRFILEHTFYYPIVIYFILMADSMVDVLFKKQYHKEFLERENMRAELFALKAQIHPHFLFNTLNNIYSFTYTQPGKGAILTRKLSALLKYMLTECNQPDVLMEKEFKLIEDYLELEKIRYGDRLKLEVEFIGDPARQYIAPLLLIPLVENTFKHGVSNMLQDPWIKMTFVNEPECFEFTISNSRPAFENSNKTEGNVGLKNVKNRLYLIYPDSHEFTVKEQPDSFHVSLKIFHNRKPVNRNLSAEYP